MKLTENYQLSLQSDDLSKFWRSKVKVTAVKRGKGTHITSERF